MPLKKSCSEKFKIATKMHRINDKINGICFKLTPLLYRHKNIYIENRRNFIKETRPFA